MTRYDHTLKISEASYGRIIFLPPSPSTQNKLYLRLDWTKPAEEQIVIIDQAFELYRPRLHQVIYGKMNSTSLGFVGAIYMSKGEFLSKYGFAYIKRERVKGVGKLSHLKVTTGLPRDTKGMDFWVDKHGSILRMLITERNLDTTDLTVDHIKRNDTVNGSIFSPKYPSNVKRIAG